ncbi:MAG: nuclear transport factor 2 family protein [Mucilaginibacter sp.]
MSLLFAITLRAQNRAQDSLAIIKTSLDYIDGYYAADADRMQSSLHPDLSKKIISTNAKGDEQISQMSALGLILLTKNHAPVPINKRREEIFVKDIFQDAAIVKIIADGWIDYLQLHKWRGHWVIVNVLWELEK